MRTGIHFTVTSGDRQRLQAIVADPKSSQKHVWRARIILKSDEGLGNSSIMAETGKSKTCVWRWQERFMHEGVNGLLRDRSRPPGKAPIPPERVAEIARLTQQAPPHEAAHWTGQGPRLARPPSTLDLPLHANLVLVAALKRAAIGRKVDITVEDARRVAAGVIDRLKKGEEAFPEPAAPEPTVADLAERYVEAHLEVNCRPGTVETFGRILRLYILPEFGHMPLSAVERGHVAALHHKMCDKPYQANQTRDVLAKMFKLAAAWGMTPPRRNPELSIRRYKEYRRERFLSPDECRRLARVLDEAEADGSVFPTAIPAILLLILTGCRKNEIVTLRWDDIDRTAGELLLRDGKTGARRVILTPAMEWLLERIPRIEGNPWVITGKNPGDHLKNLDAIWLRLRKRAGLDDVRVHDCRHSYASRALAIGEAIPLISEVLGHRKFSTTARYAHLARDGERASAAKVGDSIGDDIFAWDEGEAA